MAEVARERKLPVDDKIHTWPHLVRMEFLVTLFVLVGTDALGLDGRCTAGRTGQSDPYAESLQRHRGIFLACRKCWFTSILGTPEWCCRV